MYAPSSGHPYEYWFLIDAQSYAWQCLPPPPCLSLHASPPPLPSQNTDSRLKLMQMPWHWFMTAEQLQPEPMNFDVWNGIDTTLGVSRCHEGGTLAIGMSINTAASAELEQHAAIRALSTAEQDLHQYIRLQNVTGPKYSTWLLSQIPTTHGHQWPSRQQGRLGGCTQDLRRGLTSHCGRTWATRCIMACALHESESRSSCEESSKEGTGTPSSPSRSPRWAHCGPLDADSTDRCTLSQDAWGMLRKPLAHAAYRRGRSCPPGSWPSRICLQWGTSSGRCPRPSWAVPVSATTLIKLKDHSAKGLLEQFLCQQLPSSTWKTIQPGLNSSTGPVFKIMKDQHQNRLALRAKLAVLAALGSAHHLVWPGWCPCHTCILYFLHSMHMAQHSSITSCLLWWIRWMYFN